MKHVFMIAFIILVFLTGIFLPYSEGEYDHFATGISLISQLTIFFALLLVPVGMILILINRNSRNQEFLYPRYLRTATVIIGKIILLGSIQGAFASNNRFSGYFILGMGLLLFIYRDKVQGMFPQPTKALAYYFLLIPLTAFGIRWVYLETAKEKARGHVIAQSKLLIGDIEAYKKTNGHYPLTLQSTIEDYKPDISSIPRFHYEQKGNAYNIYFEQMSTMFGSQEIVMYNKLDEQQMTVHNQDLLRIPYSSIFHGYHKVEQLPERHWKVFYFD